MEFYRKERSKETLDEHIKFVKGKLNKANKNLDKEICLIERLDDRMCQDDTNNKRLTNKNKQSIEAAYETTLILSGKKFSNYPKRIKTRAGQVKYIKIGCIIISLIFLANAVKNKRINTTDINQTSIETHFKALKGLTEHEVKDQASQIHAITKEITKKTTNIDSSDHLENAIGLPTVDEYNKLAKSKGDSCRIGKVNNVWQKVCD